MLQVKSDFISEEPKDLKGAIALYRNISRYLGSRESNYENSVPQAVILQPIKEVRYQLRKRFYSLNHFQLCKSALDVHPLDLFELFEAQDILDKLEHIVRELKEVLILFSFITIKFFHQLLNKRASKDNISVKEKIEKFLNKIQEYVHYYEESFQEAIQNEKSGSPDRNSTLKNLSMKILV